METLSRHELLSLYDEYILPKPQRKIFCKNPERFAKKTSSPEKSVRTLSSPEKFTKQSNSVSPVKDSEVNRKRVPDSLTKEGFQMNILIGDLFKSPNPDVSLAHCISRDLKMGKGIAKTFRDKFGCIQELSDQKANIGEIAILKVESKFIYNLVTKARYFDKPTYENLWQSLQAMKEHAVKNQVKNIAMPKIGCGLDRLEWNTVSNLIMNVFLDIPINIDVYFLESENQFGN